MVLIVVRFGARSRVHAIARIMHSIISPFLVKNPFVGLLSVFESRFWKFIWIRKTGTDFIALHILLLLGLCSSKKPKAQLHQIGLG